MNTRSKILATLGAAGLGLTATATVTATAATTAAASDPSCASGATPACLEALYNIPASGDAAGTHISVIIPGSVDPTLDQDLRDFAKRFAPDGTAPPPPAITTVGLPRPAGDISGHLESALVTEYLSALAPKATIDLVFAADDTLSSISDAVNTVSAGSGNVPDVLLVDSARPETAVVPANATGLCNNALARLGIGGITVLAPSGDDGVGAGTAGKFTVNSPADCPYVTAVGGTAANAAGSETAAALSGGGFSTLFTRPDYQTNSVSGYLNALGNTYAGKFSPNGRALPDVSADSVNVPFQLSGRTSSFEGTTAAATVWAAVVARLDATAKRAHLANLGFANTFLYTHGASALNDITSGSNPGVGTSGFNAAVGWDAVTGLGTPNYLKLSAALFQTTKAGTVSSGPRK